MPATERQEKTAWHAYFNPCGAEPINGYVYRSCKAPDCMRYQCMAKGAFMMARYVITKGTSLDHERIEYKNHLESNMVGSKMVSLTGESVKVTSVNASELAKGVADKAKEIVEQVDMCVRMSTPITDEYVANCSAEQQLTLAAFRAKVDFLGKFRGGLKDAQSHVEDMRQIVQKAVDLGLGELGLVARYAIGFGFGDQIPQFAASSQIFKWPGEDDLEYRP